MFYCIKKWRHGQREKNGRLYGGPFAPGDTRVQKDLPTLRPARRRWKGVQRDKSLWRCLRKTARRVGAGTNERARTYIAGAGTNERARTYTADAGLYVHPQQRIQPAGFLHGLSNSVKFPLVVSPINLADNKACHIIIVIRQIETTYL